MSPYHYALIVLLVTLSTIFNNDLYLIEALNSSFSVELIHRDSPKFPFYNSSETQFERMANAIHRSLHRVQHFHLQEGGAYYEVLKAPITNAGEFLMKFSIGTPKYDAMAVVDTGSNTIWLQCQPCEKCYKQINPIFDPSKSKTYKDVLCSSKACRSIRNNGCTINSWNLKCHYKQSYGDGSNSYGSVAEETLTFATNDKNSPAQVDRVVIGCGHKNLGVYLPESVGLIGLGNGPTSLTSQLGAVMDNKFSYCLSPQRNIASILSFGQNAIVSGQGTVSTLLSFGPFSSFYYITLKGMTVAGTRLDLQTKVDPTGNSIGNIMLDSGSTLTFLPEEFYMKLESLVASKIKLKRITDQNLKPRSLKLCYQTSPLSTFRAPPITVHFVGGDIVLNHDNTFSKYSDKVVCFNFNIAKKVYIYGNKAQSNFLVGIDRQKKIVSFKPTECSKF